MNFNYWMNIAKNELSSSENPNREAEILLSYVTGKSRTFIIAFNETKLTYSEINYLYKLLTLRRAGVPIAYLIGEHEFWSLPVYVSPVTIIPRADTECLVEQALLLLPNRSCHVLDLGTGTGAISLALAIERPDCIITAIDISTGAVELAQRNVNRLKLNNINIYQNYWFDSLKYNSFDLIISNPPYLGRDDPHLKMGDLRFEPNIALISNNNGLADLNYIIAYAYRYLKHNGWLLVEHGWNQGKIVRSFFINRGYHRIHTCSDYSGNDRVTTGQYTL